jgi:hypothetical protein
MANTSNIYIGFSPNNFYYVDATNRGAEYAPDDSVCGNLISQTLACGHNSFKDTSFNCLQQEMCKNKELAQSLVAEYDNNGGNVKFLDFQNAYYGYLIKSVNLGVGIAILMYIILWKRNTQSL